MNRLRSSRRLETETKRNVEVMWLLATLSPDHKTIANFQRENGMALKRVFRDFVGLCVKRGLYGKESACGERSAEDIKRIVTELSDAGKDELRLDCSCMAVILAEKGD
jgi:hypothetical protein